MPAIKTLGEFANKADAHGLEMRLKGGADPNDPTERRYNASPLYWAANGAHELDTVLACAKLLLDGGADAEWATPWDGSTALHRAATTNDHEGNGNEELLKLLVAHGSAVDRQCKDGKSALHGAAEGGHLTTCEVLVLQLGATPTLRSAEHGTPAECAERAGHTDVAVFLRALPGVVEEEEHNAAEVTAATRIQAAQRRRLAVALVETRKVEQAQEQDEAAAQALAEAARNGDLLPLQALVRNGTGLDTAANEHGQTPLCLAAQAGHAECVRTLLANGADDSVKSAFGTALDLAEKEGHSLAAAYLILDDRWLDCTDQAALLLAGEARREGLKDHAMPTGTRVCVGPHGEGNRVGTYELFERSRFGANSHYIRFDDEGLQQVVLKKRTSWSVLPVDVTSSGGAAGEAASVSRGSGAAATVGTVAVVGAAGAAATAAGLTDAIGNICEAVGNAALSNTSQLMAFFETETPASDSLQGGSSVAADGAIRAGSYLPVVGLILRVAYEIYGIVKTMEQLPESVASFFRQVATANRLLRDAFVGLEQLTAEGESHMEDLLQFMQTGQGVCETITNRQGTLIGYVLAKSDKQSLDDATDGVTRSLGLCVAEVAADALPRLKEMQRKLSELTVTALTAEDKAKLDALPPPAIGDGASGFGFPGMLVKTSTREELEEMKRAMKQQMQKQQALEQQLAHKQDQGETKKKAPDTDQEVSVGAGGGSMQVQASAASSARGAQGQVIAGDDRTALDVAQMQEQLADIRMSVVQHEEQIQQLRETTGLQLSLPQAVAQIRAVMDLEVGMRTKDVVAYAYDELGIELAGGATTKTKVARVCAELNIETGWEELLAVAVARPRASTPPPVGGGRAQRDELLHGVLAAGRGGGDDDDIC